MHNDIYTYFETLVDGILIIRDTIDNLNIYIGNIKITLPLLVGCAVFTALIRALLGLDADDELDNLKDD